MAGLAPLDDLARALWAAPLADPAAPGRTLAAHLPSLPYRQALRRLRALVGWQLPCAAALEAALQRWEWSIELALLAVDSAADSSAQEAALGVLAARIGAQNRRHAALSRRLWALGRADAARAALTGLDPASPGAIDDLAWRCEMALMQADWPAAAADLAVLAALPAGSAPHARLIMLQARASEGAAGLARLAEALPDDAALRAQAALLFRLALGERAYPLARRLAGQLGALHGTDSPPAREAAILLALDGDAPQRALDLLQADLPADPWAWDARQHIRWLRAQLALADRLEDRAAMRAAHAAAQAQAEAALRLHPGHAVLRGLWLSCAERCLDWNDLETRLREPLVPGESALQRAAWLDRLGLHEAALAQLPPAIQQPDMPHPLRAAIARRRAESTLRAGDPAGAEAILRATEALPLGAPQRIELAFMRAECALWRFDAPAAQAALAPIAPFCAERMGFWLLQARAAFLRADFAAAGQALERFGALKARQLDGDAPPLPDLRERITADARRAISALPAPRPEQPLAETLAGWSADVPAASRGLAAWLLATGLRQGAWRFTRRAETAPPIPPRLIHYWEGPPSVATQRSLDAWARHHPGLAQTLFDRHRAGQWLARHAPALLALFERQKLPATRADLFRIAWLHHEGGIYADLDEFPRRPVEDWLDGAAAVFCIETGQGTVANNFIAAAPRLPLLGRMLTRIAANLRATAEPYPWWDSGPAPLSQSVLEALTAPAGNTEAAGLRLLSQAEYCARISTNLPFPHKRNTLHWR